MRIFFDSNIWIAAILTPRACRELANPCWAKHTVLITEWVFKELRSVLGKKMKYPEKMFESALLVIQKNSLLVGEAPLQAPICCDPDDDHILAGASGGQADCLITGDQDLLSIKMFANIPIFNPSAFWRFEQEFEHGR